MEEYCKVCFKLSYQYIKESNSRINEGSKVVNEIVEFSKIHKPFLYVQVIAISTGVVGKEIINCNEAIEIGTTDNVKIFNPSTFFTIQVIRGV